MNAFPLKKFSNIGNDLRINYRSNHNVILWKLSRQRMAYCLLFHCTGKKAINHDIRELLVLFWGSDEVKEFRLLLKIERKPAGHLMRHAARE